MFNVQAGSRSLTRNTMSQQKTPGLSSLGSVSFRLVTLVYYRQTPERILGIVTITNTPKGHCQLAHCGCLNLVFLLCHHVGILKKNLFLVKSIYNIFQIWLFLSININKLYESIRII